MTRPAVLAALAYLLMMFLMPSTSICEDLQAKAKQGRELHFAILAKHKNIDKSYREPFVHGALTANPLLCVSVPEKDWESLSESKKDALAGYVASLINNLKSDPFRYYNGVDSNAPAAPIASRNIEKMSTESWGIMIGRISPDGRDIMSDRVAKSGK